MLELGVYICIKIHLRHCLVSDRSVRVSSPSYSSRNLIAAKAAFRGVGHMSETKNDAKLEGLRSAVRQQKGKLYIIKKCIVMLICGSSKYVCVPHY